MPAGASVAAAWCPGAGGWRRDDGKGSRSDLQFSPKSQGKSGCDDRIPRGLRTTNRAQCGVGHEAERLLEAQSAGAGVPRIDSGRDRKLNKPKATARMETCPKLPQEAGSHRHFYSAVLSNPGEDIIPMPLNR